jgi:hypothetical protein
MHIVFCKQMPLDSNLLQTVIKKFAVCDTNYCGHQKTVNMIFPVDGATHNFLGFISEE